MAASLNAFNPMTWAADAWETSQGRESNIGRFTNEANRIGRDVSGATAREAANKAANLQEKAQSDMEKRIYDKKNLDEASDDMAKKRAAQKAMQMKQGGRASTILTGGLGGSVDAIDGGKKVLLGQ